MPIKTVILYRRQRRPGCRDGSRLGRANVVRFLAAPISGRLDRAVVSWGGADREAFYDGHRWRLVE